LKKSLGQTVEVISEWDKQKQELLEKTNHLQSQADKLDGINGVPLRAYELLGLNLNLKLRAFLIVSDPCRGNTRGR
ncbi:hypothetical protein Zmor_008638, partial [Zophobas morio]